MSLVWVIAITIFQLGSASFIFMMAIFFAASFSQEYKLSFVDHVVLKSFVFVPSILAMVSAITVVNSYRHGVSSISVWWYASPWLVAVLHMIYVFLFMSRRMNGRDRNIGDI